MQGDADVYEVRISWVWEMPWMQGKDFLKCEHCERIGFKQTLYEVGKLYIGICKHCNEAQEVKYKEKQ